MNQKSNNGFSLVELLVVTAIIAVLAGILFPVFRAARQVGPQTQCLSNMSNLLIAEQLYQADYNGSIIPETTSGYLGTPAYPNDPVNHATGAWPNPSAASRLGRLWVVSIQPYIHSQDILFCPSFSLDQYNQAVDMTNCDGAGTGEYYAPSVFNGPTYTLDVGHGGMLSHYGMASVGLSGPMKGPSGDYGCIYGIDAPVGSSFCPYYNFAAGGWVLPYGCSSVSCIVYQNLSESVIKLPQETMLFGDGGTQIFSTAGYGQTQFGYPRVINFFGCEGTGRHGTGANYGFADNHAKYIASSPETILARTDGGYYLKYLSYDMPGNNNHP